MASTVLTALLAEIGDLKRIRTADAAGSLAERGFLRAWGALLAGADAQQLALHETGRALAATRLAGIDARVLRDGGLSAERAVAVMRQTVRQVAARAHPTIVEAAASAVGDEHPECDPPAFASRLCAQPEPARLLPAGRAYSWNRPRATVTTALS